MLRKELGKGGEGAVYEVDGQPDLVAKIYFTEPDAHKSSKILAMVNAQNERLLKLAAWPIGSAHLQSGKLIGFLMHKLENYKPLFELYSPKLRMQTFPKADWRFLIHAATNIARAFSVVHEAGHVIGDVNHGNLLVAGDATVKFIDTDSFQIFTHKQQWWCEVGVATHQPPEMQGHSTYKGLTRTPNHDNFGLAVLIFQMLCLARHPFSGRFLGSEDMPIEKAISEFRYAYALDRRATQMLPPPYSMNITALGPDIRSLFESAFSQEGVNGHRPTAKEWIVALEGLASKLKTCSVNSGHHYLSSLTMCSWCELESKNGLVIFLPVIQAPSVLTITGLWQQIEAQQLGPPPLLPDTILTPVTPSDAAKTIRSQLRSHKLKTWILGLVTGCIGIAFPNCLLVSMGVTTWRLFKYKKFKSQVADAIRQELHRTKQNWELFSKTWSNRVSGVSFISAKRALHELKQEYDSLPSKRENLLKNLWNHYSQQQLAQHLDQCRIEFANLDGFGPGRIATLQSYGIETAGDINRLKLSAISGFGDKLVQRLIDWRRQCEALFSLDPASMNTQSIVASIDRDIAAKRQKIEQGLATGAPQLTTIRLQEEKDRQRAIHEALSLLQVYAQAAINAKEIWIYQ
jgi:DNA-binding helix-hairpin-helix protein with protein kinase domain